MYHGLVWLSVSVQQSVRRTSAAAAFQNPLPGNSMSLSCMKLDPRRSDKILVSNMYLAILILKTFHFQNCIAVSLYPCIAVIHIFCFVNNLFHDCTTNISSGPRRSKEHICIETSDMIRCKYFMIDHFTFNFNCHLIQTINLFTNLLFLATPTQVLRLSRTCVNGCI